MEFTASQIANILEGEIVGDKDIRVTGLSKIEEGKPNTLTFLANKKYEPYIYQTAASIAIVSKSFSPTKNIPNSLTLIKVDDPYSCFAKILEAYNQLRQKVAKREPGAYVAESAVLGENLYIGANAYLGENVKIGNNTKIYPNAVLEDNVSVGENTIIYPNVTIYHDCIIGNNCVIHAGAVIGADGFGFAPDENGEFQKVPQIGNVILEDFVDVGANTTIDRSTLGSTILRRGVKVDNLVQIAHNVEVGQNSAFAAQAGVAGSTKIGKHVLIGGQVGISGHIKIEDGSQIVAQSGIPNSIKEPGQRWMGSPALPLSDFKRTYTVFRMLPDILQRLKNIEKNLDS